MQNHIDFYGKEYIEINLPKLESSELYEYLGVYINLELNWDKQRIISKKKLLRQNYYLRSKCFNTTQTIDIINKVIISAAVYRMYTMNMGTKWC